MDLFLINGQDGPSLSEMVDCDIKSASDIGGDLGMGNYFGLGYDLDLPSLDFEEAAHIWPHPYTANSNSSFELDFFNDTSSSLMVNPNSIMPFVSTTRTVRKETKLEPEEEEEEEEEEELSLPVISQTTTTITPPSPCKAVDTKPTIPIVTSTTTTTTSSPRIPIQTAAKVELTPTVPAKKLVPVKKIEFVPVNITNSKTMQVQQAKRQVTNKRHYLQMNNNESSKEYPKPAYSYSCLIAMALKNSRSGSLPVSEIYSFMCDHFPYFKTAPNGWKNSVRHNLSLNKCFEKIEKPQAPGACGAQRKGCLWAMNPLKIAKMDDEVAKWSRKDPSAIKKAMVYPENLELLERGEMKIGSVNSDEELDTEVGVNIKDSGDESEDEEEEEDDEEEEEDDAEGCGREDDVVSTIDDESEDEISRVPPSLQPFDSRIAQFNQTKHMNSLTTSADSLDDSSLTDLDLDMDVEVDLYEELEVADTRTLLGLEEGAPTFGSDSEDESEIAIPVQKRPRIQGNYMYQPVNHINKHNISGFRSITVENP